MKTTFILVIIMLFAASISYAQPNFHSSDNFTIEELPGAEDHSVKPVVYVENDSIWLKTVLYANGAGKFSLKISDLTSDTIYVLLTDTAQVQPTYMANYDICINIGKAVKRGTAIVFNGTSYQISGPYYTAVCQNDLNQIIPYTHIYIKNDSIKLNTQLTQQCCAKFALTVSDITEDTIYVHFADTATEQCNCICNFDIEMTLGKALSTDKTIHYNGYFHRIQPADYQPLIQLNKIWNSLLTIPGLDYTHATQIENSITKAEGFYFCWNGKKYYRVDAQATTYYGQIGKQDTIPYYIREENGKVYAVKAHAVPFIFSDDGCEEVLLYDFTLAVGDTVTVGFDSTQLVVVPTTTDNIYGRRQWALADLTHPELSIYTTWIEGVGDTRGLLKSGRSLLIVGVNYTLTCCNVSGNYIYQNPQYPECGIRPKYQYLLEVGKKWRSVVDCTLQDSTYLHETEIKPENLTGSIFSYRFYPDTTNKLIYFQENSGRVTYFDNRCSIQIYDFTVNAGDSVEVAGCDFTLNKLYVDSVSYLTYEDDALRKTIYLSGNGNVVWVEGIGDIASPLGYWMPLTDNGCFANFACCWKNDELLWRSGYYPDCANYCEPAIAAFTYGILESYPVQIGLTSTAQNADSIVWKSVSKYSGLDTIIGTGELARITNPYLLKSYNLCASAVPCVIVEVTQKVSNACSTDSISKYIYIEPLLNKEQSDATIKLYPNPTDGSINFINLYPTEKLTYTIYNVAGYELASGKTDGVIQTYLSGGIYFIELSRNNQVVFRDKLVVK